MEPEIRLDANEARVLGVLVEKALTIPEQYPLTLHATVSGVNQKNNRNPVLSLSEEEVESALDRLIDKELARRVFPGNSRVDKFCHTGTSTLKIEPAALAVLAELLLRGPETAAELRTRASRMIEIGSAEQLHEILRPLLDRGLACRLPPGPGSRAERIGQRLSPESHIEPGAVPRAAASSESGRENDLATRLAVLESAVEALRRQLCDLAARLGEPID